MHLTRWQFDTYPSNNSIPLHASVVHDIGVLLSGTRALLLCMLAVYLPVCLRFACPVVQVQSLLTPPSALPFGPLSTITVAPHKFIIDSLRQLCQANTSIYVGSRRRSHSISFRSQAKHLATMPECTRTCVSLIKVGRVFDFKPRRCTRCPLLGKRRERLDSTPPQSRCSSLKSLRAACPTA